MSQQLSTTLKTLWTQRKAETLQKGWGEVPDWVFINEKGQTLDDCNLRNRIFHRCL
jgi:hypothetical protein